MFVFFHPLTSILAEKLSSKLHFLKSRRISSQTWDCNVLGFKKPCGKPVASGAWSSCTRVKLKLNSIDRASRLK